MKWNSRIRCALVCLFFTALFSLFSFRLVYLQMIKHDEYSGLAAEKPVYQQAIFAERGSILDANNEVLAHSAPVETVVADATHINSREALIPLLRNALGLPADELSEKLEGERRYIVLKREVPIAAATALREKLRAQNLRGIYFERDTTRIYPNASMLCHVIGFTDFEHRGIQGVESSMEEYLHGQDGYRFIEHNRAGQEIVLYRGQERAPRDGYQVHLTVDLNLQNIVENEIDAAVREYSPQKATIILMRPQTGEILAMANRPNFDLNERSEAKPEQMKNRAIIDMMEPGSTFKIVSAAAALNERKVRPDTTIFCENGIWNVGGKPLHDHKAYGELSVQDILVKSSNIGAAKLAISIGEQKFYEYIRRFGFGDRTGINVPGKTGTGEKVDPHGGYEHGKYVVSFSGYLPSDHPQFVGLVVLDDAKTANPELNYGGLVAGPIFARIAEKAARYLDLQPHEDIGKASAAARMALTNAPHR